MISVIVLTYNQEQYITQALDGILTQKIDVSFEIVIGNDASTDHTEDICKRYLAEYPDRIRLISNVTNKGLVRNFIDVLKECRGDYIALCDGDDYWIDNHKLLKQWIYMQDHPQCVLIHSSRKLLVGEELVSQPFVENAENPIELFYNPYICVPTVMFRMSAVKDWLHVYEDLAERHKWKMQDYPLWLYLGTKGVFAYQKEEQVVYRVLPVSLSREKDKQRKYDFDKSVLSVKLLFSRYYSQMACKGGYEYYRFQEMVFHMRKRMLLDYGWMAREQLVKLICTPFSVWKYVISSKLKRRKA